MLGLAEGTLRYAAFHPAEVVDWLLPFAFGRPNLGYWGKRLNPDGEPIFFTLHIGLVALALVLASGRARTQGQRWAWTMVAVGIFMGLGGHNPLLAWLSTVPGIQAFRFPIKFWLLVVVGTSTLVGYACERLLRGEGRVSLRRAVLALVLLEIALLAIAVEGRGRLAAWVVGVALPASRLEEIWRFWLASAVLALLLLLGALAILWLLRRRPVAAVTALIALQTASQLWWLSPLLATDERREFAEPPAALRFLTKGQLALNALEQDGSGNEVSVRLTDRESRSLQRVHWVRLAPFSGVLHGVDYELFLAPEGLDSHFAYRTSLAMEGASDVTQVRLARALGVDVLITPRPAVGPARDLLTLRGTATAPAVTTFVYGVDHTAPPIVVSGDIVRTPDVGSMLTAAIDPQFDPTSMVVAAGPGGRTRGRVGRAVVVRESANEVVARFEAPDPAVAVVRRAYLPIYRATVDGNPAPIVLANAQRLGVEVPAGEHDLRIWVDRRPFYWSLLVSAVAVGGLWGLAWSSRARPRADGVPA
jgi:hypothetical protein